jgi:type IV fimbrial biogenesis protein FimT
MLPATHQVASKLHLPRGFSLFELLVVMCIAGILTSIAVPSYRYVTTSNRIAAEINGLLGDLQYARSEAIKEGQNVTVCVSMDHQTCATTTYTWASGWIVTNAPTSTTILPMRIQTTFTGTDTLTPNPNFTSIVFNREGFATVNSASATNGAFLSLHATPATTTSTRCLSLTIVGLMTVLTYNAQDNGNTCT